MLIETTERPEQSFSLALVDGDILAYRVAISAQDERKEAVEDRFDILMGYCLDKTIDFASEENFQVYLTGKDNFRYEIAKSHPYKGNRKGEKPAHLEYAREYAIQKWGAVVIHGAEADDAIATHTTEYADKGLSSVIVSIDKDFNTVPGWKYNFVKDTWRYDDDWSALKYFYTQVLTGDSTDNIVGLWRVGPVKAGKMLQDCTTEDELWDTCLKSYLKATYNMCGQGESVDIQKVKERVVENARLLHLQRHSDELWEPPL